MSTRDVGTSAEQLAERHLEHLGYRILARNFRVRGGELDLVAVDGTTLCFVEVRARATRRFGRAEETISHTKRRRLILAAQHWLVRHPWNGDCRFDVVAIHGDPLSVDLIRDAFRLE